jgi:hemerythrin superfamily protein
MDIFKALSQDHRQIERLLKKIEKSGERATKTRDQAFHELRRILMAHTKAEEKVFYDRLKESDETRDDALEGFEEHHLADLVLAQLSVLKAGAESWAPKFKVLKELVTNHIEEEEDEVFSDAREELDPDEIETLGEEFVIQREELLKGMSLPRRMVRKAVRGAKKAA